MNQDIIIKLAVHMYHETVIILMSHSGRLTHICVSKLTLIGSDKAWHLVGTKPLSELMLGYCWLDPQEQNSAKFNQNSYIIIKKIHLKMSSWYWWPFCLGLNVIFVFMTSLMVYVIRSPNRPKIWTAIIPRSNTQDVRNGHGYLAGIFNFQ